MNPLEPIDLEAIRIDQQLRCEALTKKALQLVLSLADNEKALLDMLRTGQVWLIPADAAPPTGRVLDFPMAPDPQTLPPDQP